MTALTARIIDSYLAAYPGGEFAALRDTLYRHDVALLRATLLTVDDAMVQEQLPEPVRAQVLRAALHTGGDPGPAPDRIHAHRAAAAAATAAAATPTVSDAEHRRYFGLPST